MDGYVFLDRRKCEGDWVWLLGWDLLLMESKIWSWRMYIRVHTPVVEE